MAQKTINLDDENVYQADLTLEAARDLIDHLEGDFEDLASELDEAQAHVHQKKAEVSYLVITIVSSEK